MLRVAVTLWLGTAAHAFVFSVGRTNRALTASQIEPSVEQRDQRGYADDDDDESDAIFGTGATTLLAGVDVGRAPDVGLSFESSLRELRDLATGAGLRVVNAPPLRRRLRQPDPATFVDADGLDLLHDAVRDLAEDGEKEIAVLFDDELSPEQQKTLERRLQVASLDDLLPRERRVDKKKKAMERQAATHALRLERDAPLSSAAARAALNAADRRRRRDAAAEPPRVRVLDRTAVVLEIFARRATTREGRLQVALARALYRTPRLRGDLFRKVDDGGESFGTNKQERRRTMEGDQKRLRDRAARLRRKIEALRRHRDLQRRRRARNGAPTVALVGYTNAGKTSVLEALTGGAGRGDDRPFATLDPRTRRADLSDEAVGPSKALVTDTVGFVSKLPAQVVAAFRATLEEVEAADVLVHVVDASRRGDARARARVVDRELEALGVGETPRLLFYNKVDLLEPAEAARLRELASSRPDVLVGAAATGDLGGLREALAECLDESLLDVAVTLPYSDNAYGATIEEVRRRGRVLSQEHGDDATELRAAVPRDLAGRLRGYKSAS